MKLLRRNEGTALSFQAILTLASACLLALAMPGHVGWWPLLFCALTPFLLAIVSAPPGRCALLGFLFGLVYHFALLYWILIVLGRYGGLSWWVSLPALLLLASYMACFVAAFAFMLGCFAGRSRGKRPSAASLVWGAPVFWVGLEYLRSILLTGFPWMDLGYGLFSQPRLIQAADLGGHALLSFTLVLCNSLLASIIDRRHRAGAGKAPRGRRGLLFAAASFIFFVGAYSALRYQAILPSLDKAPRAWSILVQGNVDQSVKWLPDTKESTLNTYLALSEKMLQQERDDVLLVWPETALPFFPQDDSRLFAHIAGLTTAHKLWLLTGAPLYTRGTGRDGETKFHYYNGALLIGPQGTEAGWYAKQHLVPFGEYVPLASYLSFLAPLVAGVGDFSSGTSQEPLSLGRMRLGVLICYESIFPDIARAFVARGANLLVNISNDAWYGRSSAPYQSLAMAVFRAVENKRFLIRAANTGISGFIDPLGRVDGQTDLFTADARRAQVGLLDRGTLFSRGGHAFSAVCACLMPALLLFRGRRRG